jgi:hypothetical protein
MALVSKTIHPRADQGAAAQAGLPWCIVLQQRKADLTMARLL